MVEQNSHRQAVKFAEDYHSGLTTDDILRHEGIHISLEDASEELKIPDDGNDHPEDEEEALEIREKIIREQQTVSDRLKEIKAIKDTMFTKRKTQKMLVERQKLIAEEETLEHR